MQVTSYYNAMLKLTTPKLGEPVVESMLTAIVLAAFGFLGLAGTLAQAAEAVYPQVAYLQHYVAARQEILSPPDLAVQDDTWEEYSTDSLADNNSHEGRRLLQRKLCRAPMRRYAHGRGINCKVMQ